MCFNFNIISFHSTYEISQSYHIQTYLVSSGYVNLSLLSLGWCWFSQPVSRVFQWILDFQKKQRVTVGQVMIILLAVSQINLLPF